MKLRWKGRLATITGYYNEVDRFPVFTIERYYPPRESHLSQHLHRPAA